MGNVTYNFRAPPSPMYLLMLLSHSVILDSLGPHGLHYAKLSCPSLSPRVCWLISTELMMPSKSHSLLPASSPALNLSQHQSLLQTLILHVCITVWPTVFSWVDMRLWKILTKDMVQAWQAVSQYLLRAEDEQDRKRKNKIKHTLKIQNNQFLVCVCQVLSCI